MKQITLTKEDFDGPELDFCFGDNTDCPIARALKRAGVDRPFVYTYGYCEGGDNENIVQYVKGAIQEVKRCAAELLAGADEAYIQLADSMLEATEFNESLEKTD